MYDISVFASNLTDMFIDALQWTNLEIDGFGVSGGFWDSSPRYP